MANFIYRSKPKGQTKFCPNHPQKLIDAKYDVCYVCHAKKNNLEIKNWRASIEEVNTK